MVLSTHGEDNDDDVQEIEDSFYISPSYSGTTSKYNGRYTAKSKT